MNIPNFDCDDFKVRYSTFSEIECSTISAIWSDVELYLPDGICLDDKKRAKKVWELITAHLLVLELVTPKKAEDLTNLNGNVVLSAHAGDTSVSYKNVLNKESDTAFDTFFKQTKYGAQFLALISKKVFINPVGVASVWGCKRVI